METTLLPSEILEVVRLSLRATAYSHDTAYTPNGDETFDPRNPALRKLVEAVLFSRKFILTYYAVLGLALLAYAAVRWTRKVLDKRKTRKVELHSPASYESSSITLRGDASPPEDDNPERRPLLPKKDVTSNQSSTGILSSMVRHIRAVWMYQPKPRPAVTSPVNVVPANSTSVPVLLMLVVNVFYLLYHTELSIPMLFAFADRAGLCFVMNLPVLYLLGAKTNQPIQFLTGWTYEGLNIFHRRLGEWMTALAAIHGVGMFGVWYTLLRPLHFTLLRFVSNRVGLLGIFTLVAYFSIYISSIGWIRKLFYERFLLLHVTLQVAALVFLFFHHGNSRPYVLASLGIWMLDRIVLRNFVSSKKIIATLEVVPDQATVLLHCDVPIRKSRWWVKASIIDGWQASQHVFVTIPGIGFAKHRLQTHPFTIASPAPPANYIGLWQLQLVVRAQDGFSKELLDYAKFHQHTEVLIDGPYGSTDTLEAMRTADRVCLIAGGSGIAVTHPLAWNLHVETRDDAVLTRRTVYQNGLRVRSPINSYRNVEQSKHVHLWVRQDPRSDYWLSVSPLYDAVKPSSQRLLEVGQKGEELCAADLVTTRFETGGIHTCRPDMAAELAAWVEGDLGDILKSVPSNINERHLVIVSGPDSLVRTVRNSAASLVRKGYSIDVHVEKFGW